jgi:hypothetical protein
MAGTAAAPQREASAMSGSVLNDQVYVWAIGFPERSCAPSSVTWYVVDGSSGQWEQLPQHPAGSPFGGMGLNVTVETPS